jgi:hypothetical protein
LIITPGTLIYYNLWFYAFIRPLPPFRALEDPAIIDEIEIALQIVNEISATHIGFDDETFDWHLN